MMNPRTTATNNGGHDDKVRLHGLHEVPGHQDRQQQHGVEPAALERIYLFKSMVPIVENILNSFERLPDHVPDVVVLVFLLHRNGHRGLLRQPRRGQG